MDKSTDPTLPPAAAGSDAAAWLEELDRLRTGATSTISQDLRTPLTAARAGLGMMAASVAGRLRPDEQRLLDNVRRNVARLGAVVDDLIVFNQLQTGTLHLDRRPVDLRTVAGAAAAAAQPLFADKGQMLLLDLPEPLPVEADARRLQQVVADLLANAHQHTPPGTRVAVSGRAAHSQIHLQVSDNGPGVPAADLERIFQPFCRLASAAGGPGLGLAIARTLVERHRGRLWAEGQVGNGVSFQVTLPRLVAAVER